MNNINPFLQKINMDFIRLESHHIINYQIDLQLVLVLLSFVPENILSSLQLIPSTTRALLLQGVFERDNFDQAIFPSMKKRSTSMLTFSIFYKKTLNGPMFQILLHMRNIVVGEQDF